MEITKITPYQFKNGKKVLNRIVVPPMASQTADDAGFVTENTIQHYKNLSQSGAGIILVEYSFVHQSGKGEAHQLSVDSDNKIHGLKRLADLAGLNWSRFNVNLGLERGQKWQERTLKQKRSFNILELLS